MNDGAVYPERGVAKRAEATLSHRTMRDDSSLGWSLFAAARREEKSEKP